MNVMRGYNRDEYEDLDEYEEDGEEQEFEEGDEDEDEYEEEEVRQPTEEELEYLELRQRLKESIRKQMKKELGTATGGSRDKLNAPRKDNYGSFFGPSQPVIAQRVIQESKSLLENPNLAARISKPNNDNNKKSVSSNSVGSKPRPNLPKATNAKKKVEILKNTRDYSFLLSDDAEFLASTKSPTNVYAPKSDARLAQLQPKSKQVVSDRGRVLPDSRDGRKQVVANGHSRPKVGPENMAPASRLPMESRKQLGSSNASGPGRHIGPKGVPSKSPAPAIGNKVTQPVVKNNLMASVCKPMPSQSGGQGPVQSSGLRPIQSGGQRPMQSGGQRPMQSGGQRPLQSGVKRPSQSGVHKPTSSHMRSAHSRNTLGQRRESQETNKPRVAPKSSLRSSRDEVRRPPPKVVARGALADHRPKAKPGKQPFADLDDEDDPINMIHKMFGYNRNKFQDDDDDDDMVTPFSQIMREEKRSSLIAKKEDEEEARLLEEEERRKRLHLAKKRKMGH